MNKKRKTGGAAPYGYRRTDSGFELHPEEAPIRKLMFELFVKHRRKQTVATELNNSGYRTRAGKMFSDSSVSRLLTDPIAKGQHKENYVRDSTGKRKYRVLKDKSEWAYPSIEPLVDEDLWNQVDNILHKQKVSSVSKRPHGLFAKYLECSCGGIMHNPHGRTSYFCSKCDNRINVDVIDDLYAIELKSFELNAEKATKLLAASKKDTNINRQAEYLDSEIKSTEKELERLYDLYASNAISKARFTKKNLELEERTSTLKLERERVSPSRSIVPLEIPRNLQEFWDNSQESEKRILVELLTNKIIVDRSTITIHFSSQPNRF
ncbi:MAG: hypothetical protein HKN50_07330 [Gammaproteobacteria bacterium]|nr:hypothetical protein [Gammaproteobacteria bacterium]